MGLLDWLFGKTRTAPEWRPIRSANTSGSVEPIHLKPSDRYDFEVVGESYRQDVLDAACGGKCEEGHNLEVTAQLILIEGNPHDPNAVGVFLNGALAAYIPRNMAPEMRASILKISPDERPVTCDAIIVGGWDRGDDDEGHYGLKLSLAYPLTIGA